MNDYNNGDYKEDVDEQTVFQDAFNKFDKGGKGMLTRMELRSAISFLMDAEVTLDHVEALYGEFDKDVSGNIDCPEFATMMRYLMNPMEKRKSLILDDLCLELDESALFAESNDDEDDYQPHMSTIVRKAVRKSRKDNTELLKHIASELNQFRDLLCVQDCNLAGLAANKSKSSTGEFHRSMALDFDDLLGSEADLDGEEAACMDPDFDSAFPPSDMRCLALVSHNGMKKTMREFCTSNKNLLKKFRLTGTNSTMTMLKEVFRDEKPGTVVFGPSCSSGPLGGDAELVAHLVNGKIGGIIFFQDPMDSHPHRADIDCLCRQALVHNTVMAETPSTALMLLQTMRMALAGRGRAELIPSFFFSLQSPTVEAYKAQQKAVVNSHKEAKQAMARNPRISMAYPMR